MDDTALLKDL